MKRYVIRDGVEDYIIHETLYSEDKEKLENYIYNELRDSMITYLSDYPNGDIEELNNIEDLERYVDTKYNLQGLLNFFEYSIEVIDI